MIPPHVAILDNQLPDAPGVYFYYDQKDKLLYIGKATSLKKRVGSYFVGKKVNSRIADLVSKIVRIDYRQTPSVLEALVLEANQIRLNKPPYNIMGRDDKSFIYLCITNEDFPKPVLMRGLDLERLGIQPFSKHLTIKARRQFLAVYGPYLSARSLRMALDLVRRFIPWSTCNPPSVTGKTKPCFDAQIGRCAGVCSGGISKQEYRKVIRKLMLFFDGHAAKLLRQFKREMASAAKAKDFERAAVLRDRVFALEHVQDIGLLMREEFVEDEKLAVKGHINAFGRIEAYDIANISGTSNVGSMVVFEAGKPNKSEYRKFRIKGFEGANDVGAMEEMLRRRLARNQTSPKAWPLPDVMIIDGGEGQVNRAKQVVKEMGFEIPLIGIAKGFDRKQDRLVYDRSNPELRRVAEAFKETFQKARDEAHRFAGVYHRVLRSRSSLGISPMRKGKK